MLNNAQMSQVFSWLCEISADSSSCFLLYFLQIASVHDFWMEENLLKRFYKLLNWSCSTLIEHFRCTFTWENHLLLCHLNPQGPLIEEKCEENWAPLLIMIIFVMVSFTSILKWAIGWSQWWLCSWKMHRILALKKVMRMRDIRIQM